MVYATASSRGLSSPSAPSEPQRQQGDHGPARGDGFLPAGNRKSPGLDCRGEKHASPLGNDKSKPVLQDKFGGCPRLAAAIRRAFKNLDWFK